MTTNLVLSFVFYSGLLAFVFDHARNTKFAFWNINVRLAINISGGLAAATSIVYMIYCGMIVHWWVPILATPVCGIPAKMILSVFDRTHWRGVTFSLAAFVGWPVCAYFMFYFLVLWRS